MTPRAPASVNADMTRRVGMRAESMEWQPSRSGTVWRKRLHLVGGAESGQVTSIVRYEKGSTFPVHDHPEGEEILVLEGTFSDEHGDWPAGTYLLNPEGFRHAPFSRDGCILFVKLRQYAGEGRRHVAFFTPEQRWRSSPHAEIEIQELYSHPAFPDSTCLERWGPGASPGESSYEGGVEILVLKGALEDEHGTYPKLSWLRLPVGASHTPISRAGCELYVKRGALPALRSA